MSRVWIQPKTLAKIAGICFGFAVAIYFASDWLGNAMHIEDLEDQAFVNGGEWVETLMNVSIAAFCLLTLAGIVSLLALGATWLVRRIKQARSVRAGAGQLRK